MLISAQAAITGLGDSRLHLSAAGSRVSCGASHSSSTAVIFRESPTGPCSGNSCPSLADLLASRCFTGPIFRTGRTADNGLAAGAGGQLLGEVAEQRLRVRQGRGEDLPDDGEQL